MTVRIAPSILSADFVALDDAIRAVERGGADLIHVDVMDGHFVPNITIGPVIVQAIRRASTRPLDVHLMISDPDRYIEAFVDAGAAMLSVHVEAVTHLHRTVTHIKTCGVEAGAVLNPSTPVGALEEIAGELDYVLVMSVNPGFGGQTFIPRSESKIRAVAELLGRQRIDIPIAVDGGVTLANVSRLISAGASIIVAGSAIFGTADPEAATRAFKAAALPTHSHAPRA